MLNSELVKAYVKNNNGDQNAAIESEEYAKIENSQYFNDGVNFIRKSLFI